MKKTLTLLTLLAFLCFDPINAQDKTVDDYIPTEANLKSRAEFSDMKFGVFIHWGIYSMFGQGEWYLNTGNLLQSEYSKAASGFYPSKFDAKAWVTAIKESGAKYITITSRHHDGFSMWNTAMSDYNIVKATPYGKDVLKMLSEECERQGIRLHFYYSHLDWGREDYPIGNTGRRTGRDTSHQNYEHYLAFMKGQLTELLTNYGKIGAIWFDGVWDHQDDNPAFDWKLPEQYDLIHSVQPACLVGNNHHRNIKYGEDIQIFEGDVPGENVAGFSKDMEISRLPLETCMTTNSTWGYNVGDQNFRSSTEIIRTLVKTSGKGANLLINMGPLPNGELPQKAVENLKKVGKWLQKYGESIYGTKAGDIQKAEWGTSTRKDNVLYLHVINPDKAGRIELPNDLKVKQAMLMNDGTPLTVKKQKNLKFMELPELSDEPDYIVKMICK